MKRELTRHLTENVRSNIGAYFQTENDTVLTTSDAVTKGALDGVNLDLFGGKLKGRIKKDGFKVLFTKQFANGGKISGPGNGRSDSILARLSNGEFVVNAKSSAAFAPLLSTINQAGLQPQFAVGSPSTSGNVSADVLKNFSDSMMSRPIKTYVTASDMSNQQQLQRVIKTRSLI